jgi:hypothetical protein
MIIVLIIKERKKERNIKNQNKKKSKPNKNVINPNQIKT